MGGNARPHSLEHPSAVVRLSNVLPFSINASTTIPVESRLTWDEGNRQANLRKHGLNFADAGMEHESRYRLDIA